MNIPSSPALRLTFINVGYGQSILLEYFPENTASAPFCILIDGGSALPEEYQGNTTGRMPSVKFLRQAGIHHLHMMVNTHLHEDHTCGLAAAAREIPADFFFHPYFQDLPEQFHPNASLKLSADAAPAQRLYVQALEAFQDICHSVRAYGGKILQLSQESLNAALASSCPGLSIQVLGPSSDILTETKEHLLHLLSLQTSSDSPAQVSSPEYSHLLQELNWLNEHTNFTSLVFRISFAGRSILLPADLDAVHLRKLLTDQELSSDRPFADLWSVGHHAQENGVNQELLAAMRPAFSVICASSDHRYHSAPVQVLDLLAQNGSLLLFTDCLDMPPYTAELLPHAGTQITICADGSIQTRYLASKDLCDPIRFAARL